MDQITLVQLIQGGRLKWSSRPSSGPNASSTDPPPRRHEQDRLTLLSILLEEALVVVSEDEDTIVLASEDLCPMHNKLRKGKPRDTQVQY